MKTILRSRTNIGRAVLVFLTCALFASEAAAQCCHNYNEFAEACRAQGGIPSPNPLQCNPRSDGSGGTATYAPGSVDAAMMSAAGQLGTAIGTWLGQALFGQQRDAQLEAVTRQYEAELAVRAVREEQEARTRRNQALLASLHGRIAHTDLALLVVEVQQLQIKSTQEMFGVAGRAAGATSVDVLVVAPTPPLSVPPTPISPERLAVLERAETHLAEARNRNAESAARVEERRLRAELAARLREEAGRQAEAARSAPPVVLAPGATAPPVDDALAEAQRLLSEATEIEGRANQELAEAQRQAEVASRELKQADAARQDLMGSSNPPAATPPSSPRP